MLRRNAYLNAFLVLTDIAALNVAFIAGNYLKHGHNIGLAALLVQNSRLLIFATFTILAIFNYFSLYSLNAKRSEVDEAGAVFGALTVGMFFFEFMTLFYRDLIFERLIILYAWLISFVLITAVRIASILVMRWLYSKGIGVSRVIVLGTAETSVTLLSKVKDRPDMGLRIESYLESSELTDPSADISSLLRSLADEIRMKDIDKVILTIPQASSEQMMKIIEVCEEQHAEFQFVPRVLDIIESRISTDDVDGVPLISVREIQLYGIKAFLKRASDIIFSLIILVITSPLILVISVAIKLSSRGGIFFVQKRMGALGKKFDMLKFRSMVDGAEEELEKISRLNEADGPLFKIKSDPRVTPVGRILRKWSLDELPQIFNVLKGHMSLVGPRPPLECEVEKYDIWHMKRLRVAPGITGLWQVSGRSDLSFEEMVRLDIFYIENWSLWLDLKIMMKTLYVVLFAKGAY